MKRPYFTTLNIVFNVTYCLELRKVMYLSYTPHILLINVESVVWTFNNFTWEIYINNKKDVAMCKLKMVSATKNHIQWTVHWHSLQHTNVWLLLKVHNILGANHMKAIKYVLNSFHALHHSTLNVRPSWPLILEFFCSVSNEVFGHNPSRSILNEYLTIFLFSIPFGYIYHARNFVPKYNHTTP